MKFNTSLKFFFVQRAYSPKDVQSSYYTQKPLEYSFTNLVSIKFKNSKQEKHKKMEKSILRHMTVKLLKSKQEEREGRREERRKREGRKDEGRRKE